MKTFSINELSRSLKTAFPEIDIAYLFGSAVNGTLKPKSDVDVAVVLDSDALAESPILDLKIGAFLEEKFKTKVDVVLLNRSNPVLSHEVIANGKRLFEKNSATRAFFELNSFRAFLDHKYYQQKRAYSYGK